LFNDPLLAYSMPGAGVVHHINRVGTIFEVLKLAATEKMAARSSPNSLRGHIQSLLYKSPAIGPGRAR